MNPVSIGLLVLGVVLAILAAARARAPWTRYRALRSQEANIARYEAWRGGLRDTGPTGASVALDLLRAQLRTDAAIGAVGILLVVAGLVLR